MTVGFEEVPKRATLRADARRNRDRILAAALEAFVESGADVGGIQEMHAHGSRWVFNGSVNRTLRKIDACQRGEITILHSGDRILVLVESGTRCLEVGWHRGGCRLSLSLGDT